MTDRDIRLLFLMELFSGFARGSYLGCIGWTTLVLSGDVATVGRIFIVQSATVILIGPIIGVMIDRHKCKKLIVMAQLVIATSMFFLGVMVDSTPGLSVLWLFGGVIIINSNRMMYQGAFSGIIKVSVEDDNILTTVARAHTIHLLATAGGMAAVGMIIDQFSMGRGFMASAMASLLLLMVARYLSDGVVKENAKGLIGVWVDFKAGLEIFKSNKLVQMLAILSAIALPVGQLTNAVLSSFIRDDLGEGSDVYGMVDAGWAIGGMLAAAMLSAKLIKHDNRYIEYIFAVLAGLATIILSFCTEVISLTVAHGFMGFFVWSCRVVIGGRIIEACQKENIGRTKVYMEVMFSVSAMIMCLSPTLVTLDATALYFQYWGFFIVFFATLLWGWKIRISNNHRPTD